MRRADLYQGDCVEVMAGMDHSSVDAVVTDPPYGLEFMGKDWDRLGARITDDRRHPAGRHRIAYGSSAASMQGWHEAWAREAFRVARPGAYLLSFGGTRTYHRLARAIEDAGWIIRDCLVWGYSSGFPKSRALLKPAWEPIVMARKPGPLRELAIDACRIPSDDDYGTTGWWVQQGTGPKFDGRAFRPYQGDPDHVPVPGEGRWPANIVLTDPIFDGGTPGVVGGGWTSSGVRESEDRDEPGVTWSLGRSGVTPRGYEDAGGYSRFFLVPKAQRSDREPVLGALSGLAVDEGEIAFDTYNTNVGNGVAARRRNTHPTVKPLDLMRHLVRLVTPADGTVLDPFLGSGTTALAADLEGFGWVGIEREDEYVAIVAARLNGTQLGLGLEVPA